MIRSVSGLISENDLKHSQCHEHLFNNSLYIKNQNDDLYFTDYVNIVSELKEYQSFGGSLIVDAQPVGAGRMAKKLFEVSKETGVKIVASTGFHLMKYYPDNHWIKTEKPGVIKNLFIKEIKEGMYNDGEEKFPVEETEVKAGIIKIAYDPREDYDHLLKTAAMASLATGVTIMAHTSKGDGAIELTEKLLGYDVKPENIIISHLDRKNDNVDFHKKVADFGVYLSYETIGRFKYHTDEDEIKLIKNMINAGYEKQILLSLDATKKRLKSYGSDIGLSYILKSFIPKMKESGFTKETIDNLTLNNSLTVL